MDDSKIPHYINDPIINAATAPELKLVRPPVNYIKAVWCVLLFVASVLVISVVVSLIGEFLKGGTITFAVLKWRTITVLPGVALIAVLLCMRFPLIWFVKIYQHYARSETRLRCCFEPSCSEYAVLALKKYGAVVGVVKAIRRLRRCHPPGGVDYP